MSISIFENSGKNPNIPPTKNTGINAFTRPIGFQLPSMDPIQTPGDGSSYGQGYVPSVYNEQFYGDRQTNYRCRY